MDMNEKVHPQVTSRLKIAESAEIANSNDSIGIISAKNIFSYSQISDLRLIIPGTICCIISALGSPAQTILYGIIFRKISEFYIGKYANNQLFIQDVKLYCFLIIAVGILKLLGSALMCYFWICNGENQQQRIRKRLFNKLLVESDISWIENFSNVNGEITQLNRCVEEVRTCNAEVIAMFIQAGISSIILFVIAMKYSWSVTLVVLGSTPLFAFFSWMTGKVVYKSTNKENAYSAQSSKILNWVLSKPDIMRLFNGKSREEVNFKGLIDRCLKFNIKVQNITNLNIGILKCLAILMFVQGFWFGNSMIKLGKLEINQVFTTFSACLMLSESVTIVTEVMGEFYRGQAAAGKIIKFLSLSSKSRENLAKFRPPWCNGEIELRDILYLYDNHRSILKHINLKLRPNEMTFIIGESGSGKSTLAQLMMNFYQPQNGQVLVDGHDIRLFDNDWLSKNITLILLNPVIFNMSLAENIGMSVINQYNNSVEDIPLPLINDAISFALLDELVSKANDQYKISPMKLSGGEKERIAIARAKLRDSPILIIDEGLSALDKTNKDRLFRSIKNWRLGKTTIFITHDLECLKADDYVVMMANGTIKRQGFWGSLDYTSLTTRFTRLSFNSITTSDLGSTIVGFEDKATMTSDSADSDKDTDMYGIIKILIYCLERSSPILIVLGMIFAVIHGITNPIFSYLFSRLLNNMVLTSIGKHNTEELVLWSCTIIGVAFINGGSYYLSNILLAIASERCITQLRELSLIKINQQDLTFFLDETHRISELNALLMNDTRDLRTMISKVLSVSISLIALLLFGIIFSIISGWKLTLVGLAFVVLTFIVTFIYGHIMQIRETKYKDKVNDLEALGFEMVNGIKTIKSLNLSLYFQKEFDNCIYSVKTTGISRAFHVGLSHGLNQTIVGLATGIIMYCGMVFIGTGEYSRLQFLQVMSLLVMTFATASSLMEELPDITRGQRSGTYIMKLLALSPSKVETGGTEQPQTPHETLFTFKNVSFKYNTSSFVLENLSFSIPKHSIFGIIGQSGSGKSTIINLITKLHGNYSGSIKLNGTEISTVDTHWLREYISIVPQSPTFFEGTIYDNLTYGLSSEKSVNTHIAHYLKLCNIHSFVVSLPEGLLTNMGSLTESSLVSTGQLQRLAMARALVRQSKVLILDECTSNLDKDNFRLMQDLIVNVNKLGVTIILISHSTELLGITTDCVQLH